MHVSTHRVCVRDHWQYSIAQREHHPGNALTWAGGVHVEKMIEAENREVVPTVVELVLL